MRARLAATLLAVLLAPALVSAATITIVNVDGAGEGFNDPTPAAPVGGNPGVTVGEQRVNAFQFAADIWGAVLESDVEIFIQSSFDPLTCTPTSATLGAAGAIQIFANGPGVEYTNLWYHVALANKLAGADLAPGPNGTSADDIVAFFNSNLNGNPACLGGRGWYYGFDTNHGINIDLVTVLLHEFGHGLGFANFVNEGTGSRPLGLGDIYSQYSFDNSTSKKWNAMTSAEIVASAINFRRVVWDGLHVTAGVPDALAPGTPALTLNSPPTIAGVVPVGTAAFGPLLSAPGITADLVLGLDADEDGAATTFTGTDGCSPLSNAGAVAGNIALIDRGGCGFAVKVKTAQNAGALAAIIGNVAAGTPPGMGGVDATIVIPSVSIMLADSNAIKAQLGGGVNGAIGINLAVRAGADGAGRALLNAPIPVALGSSISHWDPVAFPNQLMEPAINADLTHAVSGVDLTSAEMVDIGWFSDQDGVPDGVDFCIGSDTSPTVVIDGCDSGAGNDVSSLGCSISDQIAEYAAGASNHGKFVSCVSHLTNALKKAGVITNQEKGAIQSCAGQADIP